VPRPACITCKRPTSERGYLERARKCAPCYRLSLLDPFDDAVAEQRVQKLFKETGQFDKVHAAMRRTMRPPPGRPDWDLGRIVELDSRRFTW